MLPNSIWLRATCSQNGLDLTEPQTDALEALVGLLLDWNKKINLISRRDEENMWTSHILHSLSILLKIDVPLEAKVLDLGTGGGLPGLPMKIARPDLNLTLLDATQKKIAAVNAMIGSLGLMDIVGVWGRAEELGRMKEHHQRYDLVVARAVAPLNDLAKWSMPFLRPTIAGSRTTGPDGTANPRKKLSGPTLVTLKGGDLATEIAQAQKFKTVKHISVMDLTLKGSSQLEEGDKKIVVVEFAGTQTQKAD